MTINKKSCNFAGFFCHLLSQKNSFRNTIRESNSMDPDQARHFATVCKGYQQTTLAIKESTKAYSVHFPM